MQNLSEHRQSVKGLGWVSDILPGLAIFLVPFFSFLSPINLEQASNQLILNIIVSLLFIFLVLIFIYFIVSIVVSKLWGKEIKHLFLLNCFGFYFLFLYLPIRSYLFSNSSYIAAATTLVIMLTLWLATVYAACKFGRIVKRLILIFSILLLTNSIVPTVVYFYNGYLQGPSVYQKVAYQATTIQHTNRPERNIYYIILDAMKSVEEARRTGILDEKPVVSRIEDLGLRYIEKSMSSYSITHLTLASIFSADHHTREDSESYKPIGRWRFFPFMLWEEKIPVPLLSYLEQANSSLLWVGNKWAVCKMKKNVNCIYNGKWKRDSLQNSYGTPFFFEGTPVFYETTPLWTLLRIIGQKNMGALSRFQVYLKESGLPKKPFFAFIHHLSPHEPFRFTETCEHLDIYQTDPIKGYKDNYHCALVRIEKFMKKINILDPEAIVVFQGDHGFSTTKEGELFDDPEYIIAMGKMFNAIKAPNSCFEKYGEPKTNVNTVRFVLNCAYGFELPFREDIHYTGYYEGHPNFGKVFERQIY